jgi:hypothetical protein
MADAAPHTLDVYEIACLAGGPDRMVDTALVALVESGRVRVAAPGCLATEALARRHPVEAAVLDAIGPTGTRSVDTVRWRLTADARILDVPRRLRDAGLTGVGGTLLPPARRTRSRWRSAPTYAGRHLLHELRDSPPTDDVAGGTCAMTVALLGREHMPDQALCRSIFEPPPTRITLETGTRAPHALDHAEGVHAARMTRAQLEAQVGRHMGYGGAAPGP